MIPLVVTVPVLLFFLALCVLHIFLPYDYEWLFRWKAFKQLRNIPGPPTLPFFGNILMFNIPHDKILQKLAFLHEKYGPVFRLWVMGVPRVFLVLPEDVEVIMNSSVHISKSSEYRLLTPWLGEGLLTSGGQRWRSHRKMLIPAFHFKILEEYLQVFSANAAILIQRLGEKVNETCVDICPYIADCTLDIICETAMGLSVNAQQGRQNDYLKAVQRMTELVVHRQMRPWLYRKCIFALSPAGREQRKVLQTLHDFTSQVIEERRKEYRRNHALSQNINFCKKKRLAFLDLLIEISETENKLSNADIREEVDTFMFEGHDTTTAGISWTLFSIASNPKVQDKVIEELQNIFGDSNREAVHEDLQRMKYLEQVIKETLRLYPSVPGVCRKLEVEAQVRNFIIPAGTEITIMPYFIHRNPNVFRNPEDFNPENFMQEEILKRHPFSYIPFSAGPRNCIGQRYAMLEEKVVISSVMRKFKLEAVERKEDISHTFELILRSKNGLKLKLTPR